MGAEWCVGSTRGEAGASLKVHLSGAKAGVWSDFSTGEGGDLLDLWAAVRSLDFVPALKEAKAYIGVKDEVPAQFKQVASKKYVRPPMNNVKAVEKAGPVVDYLTGQRKIPVHVLATYRVSEINHPQHGPCCAFPISPPDSKEVVDMVKYLAIKREVDGKKVILP